MLFLSGITVPGYLAKLDAMKEMGIDEILIYCVNDGAGKYLNL